MGTRGLTKVISNDAAVVAQYGQWDHYPSGQGLTALQFLRDSPDAVASLRDAVPNLHAVTDDEIQAAWIDAGARPGADLVPLDVADTFAKRNPGLTRDTGARILELIADRSVTAVSLEPAFEMDTLFCEGVVEVNLDTDEFIWREPGYNGPTEEYRYPLSDLPTDEKFLTDTEHYDS